MNTHLLILVAASSFFPQQPPEKVSDKKTVAAPAAKAVELTVEQALTLSTPTDLQFSPDGGRLAFTVLRPSKGTSRGQEIWMLDVHTRKQRRFTISAKSDRMPRWSPDGMQLAFISDRDERAQIYLIPADGGEAERLTEGKNAIASFEWSPDGKHIAFLAPEPKSESEEKKEKDKDDARVVDTDEKLVRLWVIEVATKKIRKLTAGNWRIAEARWARKGDRLFVTAAEHPEPLTVNPHLFSVALADGAMKKIHSPPGPVADLQVSPDGNHLTFLGARAAGPVPHDLFLLPFGGGQPRNLTSSVNRRIEGYTWQKDGHLLAVADEGFRSRSFTLLLDGKSETLPLPGADVNPGGRMARSDSGLTAFVGQTAVEPAEVWLAPAGGRAERVTKFNEALRKLPLVKPEFYRYASFDKTEIEAALYRPKGLAKDTRSPLVVLIHGGPTARWSDGFNAWSQLLAARGYAVFCPNIRGSTGYGWAFLERNRADWGGGDFKDVMAGVDDLIARGIADPNRLGIAGWSYGGYMAAWAITQTTRFKAALVGAGMSDLTSEFGTEMISSAQYDHWFYGVPYEKPDGFVKSSPITYIKNARTPTLILHGENDLTDPIGQAQQLYRGLKHYGVKCELVIYPRAGHGPQEEKHLLDLHHRLCRWFDTHLK